MDKKAFRPFVGVVFAVNQHTYFAPLSSPKEKHKKMKNTIDFLKINNGIWGAINFNNMIPINTRYATKIIVGAIERTYNLENYNNLLSNQLTWCNANKEIIFNKAQKLYNRITQQKVKDNLTDRCCNFKLLEQKCMEYEQSMSIGKNKVIKATKEDKEKSAVSLDKLVDNARSEAIKMNEQKKSFGYIRVATKEQLDK